MICPKCGNSCKDEVLFCNRCGNSLKTTVNENPEPVATASSNNNTMLVGIIVAGLVLLGLIAALIVYLITSSSSSNENYRPGVPQGIPNSLVDSRDGQEYKIVRIGGQVWTAENMNFYMNGSWCMSGGNCKRTGRLYTWYSANRACPSGWHLPSKYEYQELWSAVGGEWTAAKALKARSGWGYGQEGSDSYGFSAIPAGYIGASGAFNHGHDRADFWTSTEMGDKAYDMDLYGEKNSASLAPDGKGLAFSVRCVMN